MSDRFALRLGAADTSSLGPLRLIPGLEVCAEDDTLWLRGTASEALQRRLDLLPATDRYALEGEFLHPIGASLPSGRLPAGPWRPLAEHLPCEPRPCPAQARPLDKVQLTLGPAAEEREATLLLTSLSSFADWASTAPAVRLIGLTFAADADPAGGDPRVLVRGRVLPPLPGVRLWEEAGLAVPCGRAWLPALPAPLVAEAIDLLPGELALLGEDGYERIPDTAFVTARRAAVRATGAEAPPVTDLGAHALASLYLGQFTPTFWRWSDDGEALVWPSGPTIALRAELEEILARLVPHGLPSLSSIAIVLAACRDEWREPAGEAERDLLSRFRGADRAAFSSQLAEARLAMAAIAGLPAHLRRGVDAKAALLEALLRTAPRRVTPEEAGAVVEALGEGVRPAQPGGLVDWAPPSLFELAEDMEAISDGVAHLDPAALEARLRTGLSEGLRPAEVELPDSERIRRLLVRLRSDDELSGLARLALDLLASVHVPRAVSSPGDQPLGGVSDLTNRGPLHRLLISELAHDPLTFTARIAHGEALYLRRETPPRRPPARRAILLDTGIRMWGVPRVFATALGLALAAQTTGGARVEVFRSEEDRLVPVDLLTREGLLDHLEALEPNPEPGGALRQLLSNLPPTPEEDLDVVLVSHADALSDPSFLTSLEGARERLVYLAAVDAQGNYTLGVHGPRGRRTLSRATLDLAPLLRPAGDLPGERLWDEGGPELPTILSRDPFPLLLPVRLDPRRTTSHPTLGTVSVTHDGRLMHWPRLDRAGRQLTARVPKGTLHWLEVDHWLEVGGEGVARAVIQRGSPSQLVVLSAQLGTGRVRQQRVGLTDPSLLAVVRLGGVMALIYPWQVDALSLSTGVLVDSVHVGEHQSWVMGRFFRGVDPRSWKALAFNGGALELVPVPVGSLELVALWDRRGLDGPWGYTGGGRVIDLSESHEPQSLSLLGRAPQVKGLSRDGHRMVVEDAVGERYVANLQEQRVGLRPVYERNHHHALQPEPRRIDLQAPQLRRRFQAMGLDAHGRLTLVSRRGRCVPFRALLGGKRLVLGPGESGTGRLQLLRDFEYQQGPSDIRYRLLLATWPRGSRAWLDSRGLLHLRSGSGNVELTLVLRDQGPLAGWTPQGGLCGPSYFTGVDTTEDHDGRALVEALEQFVRELA